MLPRCCWSKVRCRKSPPSPWLSRPPKTHEKAGARRTPSPRIFAGRGRGRGVRLNFSKQGLGGRAAPTPDTRPPTPHASSMSAPAASRRSRFRNSTSTWSVPAIECGSHRRKSRLRLRRRATSSEAPSMPCRAKRRDAGTADAGRIACRISRIAPARATSESASGQTRVPDGPVLAGARAASPAGKRAASLQNERGHGFYRRRSNVRLASGGRSLQ